MKSFQSLGIVPELIQALQKVGVKEPTPIQENRFPHLQRTRCNRQSPNRDRQNAGILVTTIATHPRRCATGASPYHRPYT